MSTYTSVTSPSTNGSLPPTSNIRSIEKEVESGLPNEQKRLSEAQENLAYYNLDAERYEKRRDNEQEWDYIKRMRLESGLVREIIDVLCEHQYNPGPSRDIDNDEAADEFLEQVYTANHINAVMHRAEVLSTLNDYAAIQVVATNDPDEPIELRLWGADEFHVFIDPNNPKKPLACVTIDRVDQQTRYRLWTAERCITYLTQKIQGSTTAGGRVAQQIGPPEENTYGVLPFAFVHYDLPISSFCTPGLGDFIRRGERNVNYMMSKMQETLDKYGQPIGYATGVDATFNPTVGPGRFIRLKGGGLGYNDSEGGFTGGAEPKLGYLQAQVDVASTWEHNRQYIDQILEAVRVPQSAVRMNQSGVASGRALLVEQAPLLTRAKSRHADFAVYETQLARCILTCAGNHYDQPGLVKAAKDMKLLLAWPEPGIPIADPERSADDAADLALGIKSRIGIVMERMGLSWDQALKYIQQVAEDEAEVTKLYPDAVSPMPEKPPQLDQAAGGGDPNQDPNQDGGGDT